MKLGIQTTVGKKVEKVHILSFVVAHFNWWVCVAPAIRITAIHF